ncbi:MAG: alpha/beta hydrolase [Clostridia bacterium]|nr:alpha/beta hydrolase [Clostridia bacterium]
MSVIRKEAYYPSSDGVHDIRALIWYDDEKEPAGVFQIAHGIAEHIGRYDRFARKLADNGYVVCGSDHLGHGKSIRAISELGSIDVPDPCEHLVADLHALTHIMSRRYPDLPYFLFGHSLGSMLSKIYATVWGKELAGLILCGSGCVPPAGTAAVNGIKDLFGGFPPVRLSSVSNPLSSKLLFGENDPDAWLSRSKVNRENYKDDPFCGIKLRDSWVKASAEAILRASASDWSEKVPKELKILFISGAKDIVGFNGAAVIKQADQLSEAGIEPTVILYPGDRHEILFEEDCELVEKDVLGWLKAARE